MGSVQFQIVPCSSLYFSRSIGPFQCHAAAKSLQLCPTLCDPIDGSPPGSPILGILQARTLEWVAISFSNAWKWKVKVKLLSCVWLFVTPWTAAYQAPQSMGFSRQGYWSGVLLPAPPTTATSLILVINSTTIWPVFALLFLDIPCPADLGLGHMTCFG